jgi:hypothetical protein
MANFIDQRMSEIVPNYPSYRQFKEQCNAAFQDTNKKTNAKNQLMLLKQGSKTAKEFDQEFDQLKFTAGYTDRYHKDVLIKLLHDAIRNTTIDHIYTQHPLPANYQGWKTQILAINGAKEITGTLYGQQTGSTLRQETGRTSNPNKNGHGHGLWRTGPKDGPRQGKGGGTML